MCQKIWASSVVLLLGLVPGISSAALVASLDFSNNGAAWTVTQAGPSNPGDTQLPLVFGLDGDPTEVGIADPSPGTGTGLYSLHQQVFAPAGYTMSDIVVTADVSGYSSWLMDGRIGIGLIPNDSPLTDDFSANGASPSGVVNVDKSITLDSSANPAYQGLTSLYVNLQIWKGLAGVWEANDVRDIQVNATLTAVPEPSSMAAILGLVAVPMFRRVRRFS